MNTISEETNNNSNAKATARPVLKTKVVSFEKANEETHESSATFSNGHAAFSESVASNGSSSCSSNSHSTTTSSSSTPPSNTAAASTAERPDNLKIIGHLKNIEKINETRRVFLNNTITEYSSDEKTEKIESSINGKGELQILNQQRTHTREQQQQQHQPAPQQHANNSDSASTDFELSTPSAVLRSPQTVRFNTNLRSPTTPPPKPPLSRVSSIGAADNRSSLTQNNTNNRSATLPPGNRASAQLEQLEENDYRAQANGHTAEQNGNNTCLVTSTKITSSVVAQPTKITTIQLQEDTPVLMRRSYNTMTDSMDSMNAAKQAISVNHYERLIEELKCPGCASPMKPPVYLCETGHSICSQCPRILMTCPLCKEAFTEVRSRSIEAMCSKAHFRCTNASGGCTVRLQIDLLGWHEKQCIYKPMRCFMGRVWGDCQWNGREAYWKEHLENEHSNKVFAKSTVDLIWKMMPKQRPLKGYYVFQVYGEMFNFYEVYDKERVLFTMTCTSTIKDKKHQYAYEVTILHEDNEALAITHKFPVHSEYDKDILAEGSCVSVSINDLAKFLDEDRLLHYRVHIVEVKSPRKSKTPRRSNGATNGLHAIDFQQTQIEGVNLKNVPTEVIVTRQSLPVQSNNDNISIDSSSATPTPTSKQQESSEDEMEKIRRRYMERQASKNSGSESDPEFEAFIAAKRWGTPQLHFNRKFLLPTSSECSSNEDAMGRGGDFKRYDNADIVSISSTSYKKRMTNTIRKSFRNFKKPAFLKSSEKKDVEKKDVELSAVTK